MSSIILNSLSFCPTPEITVKFHDWLNVKEIKAESLQICNYQMKLLLFHFFIHFHIQSCQALMQTGFAPLEPAGLPPQALTVGRRQAGQCVMDRRTAGGLGRPIASILSYIEDLRTVAHTVEPERQALSFSSRLNLHRHSWGRPEEVVYLNHKAHSL